MNEYVITTDNNADLPDKYLKEHGVGCMYLSYAMDGKNYTHGNFLPEHEFYEAMRNGSMPTTAQVNPENAKALLEPYLKKADYQNGDVKQQVSNILKSVFSTYRFQSFGEYSALLSCFNIEAKQVRGEFEGTPYNGIVYTMTDNTGKPVCTPIKSSLIGKRFGYEGLEKRIGYNTREYKNKKRQPKIRNEIALAMHGCRGNREDFIRLLNGRGIDVVFRENGEGRIYGATFIDHRNREVYNGSRLGKEFSANAFERLFNNPGNIPNLDAPMPDTGLQSGFSSDMESAIEQAFGIFDFEANGPDPQEEALARRLYHKKKKKRRSRGIS